MAYLQCEACPVRGLGSDEEPEPAEYLTGEMQPKTPTCRKCIEWAVDNMEARGLPFSIVRLTPAETLRQYHKQIGLPPPRPVPGT